MNLESLSLAHLALLVALGAIGLAGRALRRGRLVDERVEDVERSLRPGQLRRRRRQRGDDTPDQRVPQSDDSD